MAPDKKITASKKIIIASYIIGAVLTLVLIIGAFIGLDLSAISIVASASYAEIAASNAFYFNKAKKENTVKIAISCVMEYPNNSADIVSVINALGGVI